MVTAQQVHLEATAALLERAYRLALGIEGAEDGAREDARELVDVLDEARVVLLAASTPTHSAVIPSPGIQRLALPPLREYR